MEETHGDTPPVEQVRTGKSRENLKQKAMKLFRSGDKGASGKNANLSTKAVPLAEKGGTEPVTSQCTIASSPTASHSKQSSQESDANQRVGGLDPKNVAIERQKELELLETEVKKLKIDTNQQARASDTKPTATEREKELERLETELKKLQNDMNAQTEASESKHAATKREQELKLSETELKKLENDRNPPAGASDSEHVVTKREKELQLSLEKIQTELEALKNANNKLCIEKREAAERAAERERELSAAVKRAETNLNSANKELSKEKKTVLQDRDKYKEKMAECQKVIDSLAEERSDLKIKNQRKTRQIQDLRGDVQDYQSQNRELNLQVVHNQTKVAELEDKARRHQSEIREFEDKAHHNQNEISELRDKVCGLESEIHYLKQQRDSLKRNHEIAEKDLNQLQSQIFHIDRGLNPVRSEAHYIQMFEGIKVEFEMSVARFSNTSGNISKNGEVVLLQTLKGLGPHSKAVSEFLMAKQRLRIWHSRARIPLIRHIAAVILFEQVLEPFVFGLSPALSHAFSSIDADIMSHEQHFNKILTVRQSLSQGTYRYVQALAAQYQTEIISQLSKLISILLPTVPKDNITNVSKRYINEAVALKNSLTEERTVYQFFWVAGGSKLDLEWVKAPEGEWGVIGMCTFPGLMRKVKDDGTELVIKVVKAAAKSLGSLER